MINRRCLALIPEKEIDRYTCEAYQKINHSNFTNNQPLRWFPTGCQNGHNTKDCGSYEVWKKMKNELIESERRKVCSE